jgi:disulfide bond formation protein DsbB
MQEKPFYPLLYFAWITALSAVGASVYFIEISGNPAAFLCWFERMLIFGLLLLLTVGIIRRDTAVKFYSIPFLVLGILSSLYQQLVHWNFIKVPIQSCGESIVCTTKFFELFGFVTQATLCLSAFVLIALFLWKLKPRSGK